LVELIEGLIIGVGSAVAGSAATYFFSKRLQKSNAIDLYLDRFPERGIDHVGVFNLADGVIDACLVFCDEVQCDWWDKKTGPRSITRRGANAQLPSNHTENPLIRVMSRHKKLRTIRFLDITPRY
jgi:hypothetical protein